MRRLLNLGFVAVLEFWIWTSTTASWRHWQLPNPNMVPKEMRAWCRPKYGVSWFETDKAARLSKHVNKAILKEPSCQSWKNAKLVQRLRIAPRRALLWRRRAWLLLRFMRVGPTETPEERARGLDREVRICILKSIARPLCKLVSEYLD